MFTAAAIAILITMALAVTRAILGPTVYDRIVAVNMFGTKTVLIIAVIAFLKGRHDLLDIALVYALINFHRHRRGAQVLRIRRIQPRRPGPAVMEAVLDILSWILIVIGGSFGIIGGLGIVRLPTFFTRIHAAGMTETMCAAADRAGDDAAGRLEPGDVQTGGHPAVPVSDQPDLLTRAGQGGPSRRRRPHGDP